MENKQRKNSINTVIYLLLGVMLISVVMVSVFTVSSRRRGEIPNKVTDNTSNQEQTSDTSDRITAPTDTSVPADTSAPDTTIPEDTKKPADTVSAPKTDDKDVAVSTGMRYFVIPLSGTVSKSFDIDIPVYSPTMNDYRAHTGIDISAPIGTNIVSASSGTVCKVWDHPLMGCSVTIDHGDGIYTTYMNLAQGSSSGLNVGDKVAMGQTIGAVGESALIEIAEEPHLHLEMKVGGAFVDPLEYMGIASPQESVYED